MICFSSTHEYTQFDCNHRFCNGCLKTYFEGKIDDGYSRKIECPDPTCKGKDGRRTLIHQNEVFDLVSNGHKDKYMNYEKQMIDVSLKPESGMKLVQCADDFYCEILNPQRVKSLECKICSRHICSQCLGFHNPTVMDCEQYKNTLQSTTAQRLMNQKYLKDNNMINCPECGISIEKVGGCNAVRCQSIKCRNSTVYIDYRNGKRLDTNHL